MEEEIIVNSNLSKDEEKELCFELRKETGYGMMDCKHALKESEWNIKKAKIYLQKFFKTPRIIY